MDFYTTAKLQRNNDIMNAKKRQRVNNDIDESPLEMLLGHSSKGVDMQDNHIYFRTEVDKESIMELDRLLKKANQNYELLEATCKIANISPKPIYLHISSNGGDLVYGLMAFDAIQNSRLPVYTIVEGNAFSSGSVMALAGKKRYALQNSLVLIHQLSNGTYGKYAELEDFGENNKLVMKKLTDVYLTHTSMKAKDVEKLLKKDIFLDSKTCIKYGMIDGIYSHDLE